MSEHIVQFARDAAALGERSRFQLALPRILELGRRHLRAQTVLLRAPVGPSSHEQKHRQQDRAARRERVRAAISDRALTSPVPWPARSGALVNAETITASMGGSASSRSARRSRERRASAISMTAATRGEVAMY